jgi:hypothetical protein
MEAMTLSEPLRISCPTSSSKAVDQALDAAVNCTMLRPNHPESASSANLPSAKSKNVDTTSRSVAVYSNLSQGSDN